MDNKKKQTLYILLTTTIYFIINLILVFYHEPWRDEINAWLFSRDASFTQIFTGSLQQGHPSLWYYLLAIFSKLGFPVITLNIISLLIMTLAVFLFLKFSPLSSVINYLLLISPLFLYNLPVISRNYCLIALLIILLGVFYKNRHINPWPYGITLAFLIHSHLMMLGLAFILWVIYLFEMIKEKKTKISEYLILGVVALSTVILFIQIVFFNKLNVIVGTTAGPDAKMTIYNRFTTFLNFYMRTFVTLNVPLIINIAFWIILFTYLVVYHRKQFLIVSVSTIMMALLSAFVYSTIIYMESKVISILYIILYAFWTIWSDDPIKITFDKLPKFLPNMLNYLMAIAFIPLYLISTVSNIYSAIKDINEPFSEARAVGEYINKNLPNDAVIVDANAFLETPVEAYIKKSQMIFNIRAMKKITYTKWDYVYFRNISFSEFQDNINIIKHRYKHVYWLFNSSQNSVQEYQPKDKKVITRYYSNDDVLDYSQEFSKLIKVFNDPVISGDETNYMLFKLK